MKTFLISFSFLFSFKAYSCGEYQVIAKIIMKKGRASFVINPQTQSEINLAVEFQESSKLSPYIDRFISTTVLIDKPMDATIGLVKSIGSIKELPPNPLANGMGTKMELIKKIDCK